MFDAVAAYLEAHRPLWSSFQALNEVHGELKAGIAAIDQMVERQQASLKGYSDDKAQVRAELEELLAQLIDAVAAYAARSEDVHLRPKVAFNRSELGRMTADNLEECARVAAAAARSNLAALADYRVSEAKVAAVEELTARFASIKQGTRTSLAGRSAVTEGLPDLIAQTRNLLRDQMDRLVSSMVGEQPLFVAGYRSVRVVVQRSATRSSGPEEALPAPAPAPATAVTAPATPATPKAPAPAAV